MDWNKMAMEVHAWQVKNFPGVTKNPDWPLMGICEEAGELMHARLKSEQGIRKTPEEWNEAVKDALSDIAIFAMSACGANDWNATHVFNEMTTLVMNERSLFFRVFADAGKIAAKLQTPFEAAGPNMLGAVQDVITDVFNLARVRGWALEDIVKDTWEKVVSKRDWTANPMTAHEAQKVNAP